MSTLALALWIFALLLIGAYLIAILEQMVLFGRTFSLARRGSFAEIAALMCKDDLEPAAADRLLFQTAPLIALTSVALAALVIPLGPASFGFDPSIGLFYFIVVLGPFVVAMMNAGWGQNAKQGLFGAFRAATYLLSYHVPLGLAAIGPAMAAESLAIGKIVDGQAGVWYAMWQPLGLAIYALAALFMTYRRPFDLPQAGSELGGGVWAEYSGPRLLIWKLSMNALFLLLCGLGVVLFFGGWQGPLLPPLLWFLLKTLGLAATLLWIGRFTVRLRHDQMLCIAWKILVPASLVNVAVVGIIILLVG